MSLSPAPPLSLALAVASLVFAAPASATTLVLPDGTANPQPYQSWVDHARVPTPPGTVTVQLAPCPGGYSWASGCADAATRAIYLTTGARTPRALLHELGHLFDAAVMSDASRLAFRTIMRLPGPWVTDASTGGPNEWFAEGYSLCARHGRIRQQFLGGNYGYAPAPRQHASVCALIKTAAAAISG